jgi:small subunit ribosomal protein S8
LVIEEKKMPVVDPIADMLTRIRNAYTALHNEVNVPLSKLKLEVAGILKREGFILDYTPKEREFKIKLKYFNGKPVINGLKKVSKPGRRIYVKADEIPNVRNGLGICILSTSQGILEGKEAKKMRVGGEIICEIW